MKRLLKGSIKKSCAKMIQRGKISLALPRILKNESTALPSYRVFHMDWYRISGYFKVNLYSGNDFFSDVDRKISDPRNIATLKWFTLVSIKSMRAHSVS